MSEADSIALSGDGPVTREWLLRDFSSLGIEPGMLLMVHTSLSQLGWVVGGAETVIGALLEAVGAEGTLLMPTYGGSTDPAYWSNPPVPKDWMEIIRAEVPAFDPRITPTRSMGACAELFRSLPGVQRSYHPFLSWAGIGPLAAELLAEHSLAYGQGEYSPMGRAYALGGHVLSLATQRTTILHLAEHRTEYPGKDYRRQGSAVLRDGRREWVEYVDLEGDDADFERIRQDFMKVTAPGPGTWQSGLIGYGESRLFAIRPLVDYAVDWITQNRI